MKKLFLCAIGLLAAQAASATTIQTFGASITGTLSGSLVSGASSVTGSGTGVLDDSGVLTLSTSTHATGTLLLLGALDQNQTATTTLAGTLTGLTLFPFNGTTIINTCADNNGNPLCNQVPLGPPGSTTPGAAPITFNITPGSLTVFSAVQDLGVAGGFPAGFLLLNSTTTLTAIPEPGTAMLLLRGLVLLRRTRRL
ncbi:MAG TPA: hypothetical protein VMS55_01425 [Myxococcota bacterium]|nr:hypothetical protein [Myxococcota bacterium]